MLIGLLLGSNIFIALCYFIIACLIFRVLLQGQQHLLKNPLVLATVGIFFFCSLGHSGHVVMMAMGSAHSNQTLLSIQVAFDLLTAVTAGIYIALRRNYSFLVEGPLLLAQTQNQLRDANSELARVNSNLESLVAERTAELLQSNQQLECEISDRKQAEAALRQSEEHFRQLAETIDDVFFLNAGQANEMLYVSPAYEKIWGRSCESLYEQPQSWMESIYPEDLDSVRVAFEQQNRQKLNFDKEFRIVIPDGSIRWIWYRCYPICHQTGELQRIVGMAEDITERKQTEAALQESESRFRQITENMDEVFWMLDAKQNQLLYVSPAYEKIWGRSCESLYQQHSSFLETIHPEDRDRIRVAAEQHIRRDGEEYRIVLPNGVVRWIRECSYPLLDSEGQVYRIIGFSEDISQRKQTEIDLQRQNLRSQMLAEITLKLRQSLHLEEILQTTVTEVREFLQTDRVIIYQLFPDGSGVVVNEAVTPNWPIILQQQITDNCFPESYIEMYRQGRIRAIADLEKSDLNRCHVEMLQQFAVKANLVVPILQGESLWGLLIAHECAHPRQWTQFECELLQQLANQVGIALSQAQFLAALRESENKYRSVVNNVKEVIFQTDVNGYLTFLNPAWTDITGYPVETSIGKHFVDYIHPSDRPAILTAGFWELHPPSNLQSTLNHQPSYYRQEIRFQTQAGGVRWLDIHAQLTFAADDGIIGTSGTLNDITERKRAEAEIRKALKQEQELSELKSRFVSMTSHEFRTPLSTILTSAELLEIYRHSFSEDKQLKHLHRIQTSVQHMTQMLNDVLVIGKAEAKKLEFNPAPLHLVTFCNNLVEEMQLSAGSSHTITFVHQGQCYATGMDERLLRHILTNLLSNAIKYSTPSSIVHLELTCQAGKAVFQIQDTGIGIPLEDQKHLFDSFYRAGNVGTIPGTGLGLAVVKKCIDLHGGNIAVHSKVGEGTMFTVTLPLNPWSLTHDQDSSN